MLFLSLVVNVIRSGPNYYTKQSAALAHHVIFSAAICIIVRNDQNSLGKADSNTYMKAAAPQDRNAAEYYLRLKAIVTPKIYAPLLQPCYLSSHDHHVAQPPGQRRNSIRRQTTILRRQRPQTRSLWRTTLPRLSGARRLRPTRRLQLARHALQFPHETNHACQNIRSGRNIASKSWQHHVFAPRDGRLAEHDCEPYICAAARAARGGCSRGH